MKKPKVTVIIPTYNRAGLLPRALYSVLTQTVSDFEILIIDDGSTDDTHSVIAKKFDEPRIRYVPLSVNGGVAAARNHGIELAQGEYLAFLDSDDEWKPEKLAQQLSAVEACVEPTKAICYCAYFYDYGSGSKIKPDRGIEKSEPLSEYLYCSFGSVQTSTILVHRDLGRLGKFPSLGAEDTDYLLQMEAAGGEFCFVNQPLSVYHADPRPGRVGPNYPIKELKLWAEESKYFSIRARHGYMATVIAFMLADSNRILNRVAAVFVFAKNAGFGQLSRQAFMQGLLKTLMPRFAYGWLRSLKNGHASQL